MDTKFGTNVSNRMLLNAANFQGYSFYRFRVIKGKPTTPSQIPLTETHINRDQIHHIRNNWFFSNFFSLEDSHTKGCLSCFTWDLKVDTDPKGRFVSFKFTPSNGRVLCVYTPRGYSTREQLDRVHLFEGLQNYMNNKNKGNENKTTAEDFNCTMDKMVSDGEKKTERPYWCCSSYALSKLTVDNGLEDLWRREKPDSHEFTRYVRSLGKNPG